MKDELSPEECLIFEQLYELIDSYSKTSVKRENKKCSYSKLMTRRRIELIEEDIRAKKFLSIN